MNAVETYDLSKTYKQNKAVDQISFSVPVGAKCGFLGKNGAGKTSTIKMLTGIKKPTSGSFAIMGEEQNFGKRNMAVGYLPDVPAFYDYMTGAEFLDLCGRLCNIPADKRRERVESLLKQVGLDRVKTRIATYSRGMKQRLGIAQAMVNEPALIFMDEPISALDPTGRREVLDIVKNLENTTVVFSTHILSDVEDICDYVLIIEKGTILAQDSMKNLLDKSAKNMLEVILYDAVDRERLKQALAQIDGLTISTLGALYLTVSSEVEILETMSKIVAQALARLDLPCRKFLAHTPSLEEVFQEVLQKGGEAHA